MKHRNFRKPAAVLAALAICLTLSVTVLAASGARQGFFRDITDFRGAITGTSYEQATDEIGMTAAVNGDELTVLATFEKPQSAPYRFVENLGIAAYRIADVAGKLVKEGTVETVKVVNGQAVMTISLDGLDSGCYTLVVTAFVTESKADQPMNLNGHWEWVFLR